MVLEGALDGPKVARPADLEGLFGKPFPVHKPELLSTVCLGPSAADSIAALQCQQHHAGVGC